MLVPNRLNQIIKKKNLRSTGTNNNILVVSCLAGKRKNNNVTCVRDILAKEACSVFLW